MSRSYLQEENYEQALKYARVSKAFSVYSDAFWEVRNTWLRNHLIEAAGVLVYVGIRTGLMIWDANIFGAAYMALGVLICVTCAAMLGAGWLYHIALRGESLAVDLVLYLLLMGVGFALPRALWPLCEWPGTEKAALLLTALLGGLIVWFTFFPPDTALFADLGGAVRTFLTIPV